MVDYIKPNSTPGQQYSPEFSGNENKEIEKTTHPFNPENHAAQATENHAAQATENHAAHKSETLSNGQSFKPVENVNDLNNAQTVVDKVSEHKVSGIDIRGSETGKTPNANKLEFNPTKIVGGASGAFGLIESLNQVRNELK